jgi:hypothetical protein
MNDLMKILMDWMGEGIMETPGSFLKKSKNLEKSLCVNISKMETPGDLNKN